MVSWSELSHFGARSAIHCKARFSIEAVSAWFTRRAVVNFTSSVVADFTFILVSSYFRNALHVDRNVNSNDSRGTLSTKGPIAHTSPLGMERVSETDSTCM